MTGTQQASGRDLARQALAAYKTGRTPGQNTTPTRTKRRRIREDRTGGRDPIGLGTLLDRIATEQAWTTSLDGGNIIDQWPTLCPQFAGTVQPIEFREDTGQLVVRPCSDTYAAHLRLLGGQLCKQINDKLGTVVVKSLGVMRVGEVTAPQPAAAPEPAAPAAPVRTPETASPGYQHARAVALEHKPDRTNLLAPAARAAIERQNQALRARREPEEAFTDSVAQQERLEAQAGPSAGTLEASIRAALAYKHTGGTREPRRLFEAS